MKKHKYGAKKTEIDGIIFDSKAEARRYQELVLLEKAGEISNLELQPSFMLLEGFKSWRTAKSIRPVKYIADFRYVENGENIVEDVKGKETPEFKIKMKLFLNTCPGLILRISKAHRQSFKTMDY